MKNNIAIITARGGSKRIPKKNIKLFLGKPIITYAISAALSSNLFDEIMVSTDDEEIAKIAKKAGASVPFYRSKINSDDYTTTSDVLHEVLTEYNRREIYYDKACCIYPTAVFTTPEILKSSLQQMDSVNASSLIPVARFPSSIMRALSINNNNLSRIWPENEKIRSQDLKDSYYDVGQFYWFNIKDFIKKKSVLTNDTTYIIIPSNKVHDIDNLVDWSEAEDKYKAINNQKL